MTPHAQIAALAELDGTQPNEQILTSYDAILPLIQKQPVYLTQDVNSVLTDRVDIYFPEFCHATPAQLCEALLRATGKWKD